MPLTPSGGAWGTEETPSPSRMNRKSTHSDTATNLGSMITYPGVFVFAETTGGSFTQDNAYVRNHDDTGWISLMQTKHLHDADTEAAGGEFVSIEQANITKMLILNRLFSKVADWETDTGSSGTATDDTTAGDKKIKLSTSTTNGGFAQIKTRPGITPDFGKRIKFMIKAKCSSATDTQGRVGVHAEILSAANDADKKIGFEWCSSIAPPDNDKLHAYSSNGTTRTNLASTSVVNPANASGYLIDYQPNDAVRLYTNGTLVCTKSDNLPNSGTTNGNDRIFRGGVKNTLSSNKDYFVYGVAMIAFVNDAGWL